MANLNSSLDFSANGYAAVKAKRPFDLVRWCAEKVERQAFIGFFTFPLS